MSKRSIIGIITGCVGSMTQLVAVVVFARAEYSYLHTHLTNEPNYTLLIDRCVILHVLFNNRTRINPPDWNDDSLLHV